MIEAVVEVVDHNAPPPPELSLAWDVERWGTLPDAGGLYDQDAVLLHRMNVFSNVYKVVTRFRSAEGAQIHMLSHSEKKLIGELRKQGLI